MYWSSVTPKASLISCRLQCPSRINSKRPASDSVMPRLSRRRLLPSSITFMFNRQRLSSSHSRFTTSLQLSIFCTSSITNRRSCSLRICIVARADSHTRWIQSLSLGSTASATSKEYGMEILSSTWPTSVVFPTCLGPAKICIKRLGSRMRSRSVWYCFLI